MTTYKIFIQARKSRANYARAQIEPIDGSGAPLILTGKDAVQFRQQILERGGCQKYAARVYEAGVNRA